MPLHRNILFLFERQVLAFPILVVALACASFLFGGRCAAWQWWLAVAITVAAPFVRKGRWREALGSAGLFALLLFAVRWILPLVVWDDVACDDMSSCHLPMVGLLVEGWNPVADPKMEAILAALGLDPWGMAPLHVAFMPKTLAVFSAVAQSFVRDPYATTFPLPTFLWLGVFLSAFRLHRGFVRWALAVALVGVLPWVAWRMPVDLSVAFASCGLLLCMQGAADGKPGSWSGLAVWTIWALTIKPTGVPAAAAFFVAFAFSIRRRLRAADRRTLARAAAAAAATAALCLLFLWNPLVTSWRTFGHPLYPAVTSDAERFPAKDLTWDLRLGNDDYHEMGRAGLLAHAYLSPAETVAFYKRKLARPDFEPKTKWWTRNEFPDGATRLGMAILFATLLLCRRGRPYAAAGLFLLGTAPIQYIGFTRYCPWLSALGCLAVCLAADGARQRISWRTASVLTRVGAVLFAVSAAQWLSTRVRYAACLAAERKIVRPVLRPKFSFPMERFVRRDPFAPGTPPRIDQLTYRENRCRLLVKALGREGRTDVLRREEWMAPGDLALLEGDGPPPSPSGRNDFLARMLESGNRGEWTDFTEKDEIAKRGCMRVWDRGWLGTPFGYSVPDDADAGHIRIFNGQEE